MFKLQLFVNGTLVSERDHLDSGEALDEGMDFAQDGYTFRVIARSGRVVFAG